MNLISIWFLLLTVKCMINANCMPEDSGINNRKLNYHNHPQSYAYCTTHDSCELDFMFVMAKIHKLTNTQEEAPRRHATSHQLLLHSCLLTSRLSLHHTAGKLKHLQIRSSCKQLLQKLNSQIHVSVCTHSYTDTQEYTIKHLHLSPAHNLLTLTSL